MTHLLSENFRNAFRSIGHSIRTLVLITGTILCFTEANAVVTITKATGGTNISADKSENAILPTYTTLGNVIVTEGALNDFSSGTNVTFTLIAPAGWKFNPSGIVSVNVASPGDIAAASVTSVTATLITIQATISGNTNPDFLSVSGIQIRPVEGGNIPCTANITRGGTAVISGCTSGAILANLSVAIGAVDRLVVTLPGQSFSDANQAVTSGNSGTPAVQTAGTSFAITKIRACDQFFNVATSYSGLKSLIYSGPSNAATAPTYTTSVSFASGVSSMILNTTLKKAETTSISVSDGTVSGPASTSFAVNAGTHSKFIVEAAAGGNIGTQVTGISFNIRITAADANNNPCTSGPNVYSGTADITSSGTLTTGNGTTPSFIAGVLASRTVSFSNQGTFNITATKTAGTETGSSNSFQVNYPLAGLSSISPSCIIPGGSSFIITVNGNNFTGTSTVRFNGSDRTTTLVNSHQLTAVIPSGDIASPGVYLISVYIPGTGSSSPLTLNMNTFATSNISVCQGSSYTLPDGSVENTTGTYITVIPGVSGCDSTITTNLTVLPNLTRSESVSICPGTSYSLPDGSSQNTPGVYVSNVTNISGCDSVITTTLTFHQAPSLSVTPVQIDCYGNRGSVSLSAVNGLTPYTFGPEATTNLIAGTYSFSVTDANGCADNSSATIDPQPSLLTLAATLSQIACSGGTGSVLLNASGGTPSYTYGVAQTTNLTAGTYNYQVTDNNGCTANASAVINTAPVTLNATTTVVNTPCGSSTGIAAVNVTGGTMPYSYSWSTMPVRTTSSITGLPTGTYTVTITDSRGCSVSRTATIINSNPVQVNVTGQTGICPGGTTTLCATTGFSSYSWSTGETTQCITTALADTIVLTATDLSGCTGVKSIITHNSTFPSCTITGGSLCPNAVLILRAPTGYASYLWSNQIHTSTNSVRSAGTYTVTVKNTDNCASTCSYVVNSPLRTTSTKTDAKCANEFKGSGTVTASAGITPYTYLWSNGNTTSTAPGLAGGTYTVRVTDAGGCSILSSTVINSNKTTYDYSTSTTNFNTTPIAQNSYVWFSAVANITYTGTYPVTIRFISQNINATGLNLVPADARLVITNAVTQASTVFTGGEWVTTAPPNLSGNYFVSGYAFQASTAIAASLNSVKWRGIWTASSSCVTNIRWKWSAAAYSSLSTNNTLINIQPSDDISASPSGNNDLAGTPENYKTSCIAGALSAGAADYVGTYTTAINRVPCSSPDLCNSLRYAGLAAAEENGTNLLVNAYPNPFSTATSIEFENVASAGHMVIEIYSLCGQKMRTIYDGDIEAGMPYKIDFDGGDLAGGIYFYKVVCGNEQVRGKLYLQK